MAKRPSKKAAAKKAAADKDQVAADEAPKTPEETPPFRPVPADVPAENAEDPSVEILNQTERGEPSTNR
jgi:hypothetical protein